MWLSGNQVVTRYEWRRKDVHPRSTTPLFIQLPRFPCRGWLISCLPESVGRIPMTSFLALVLEFKPNIRHRPSK